MAVFGSPPPRIVIGSLSAGAETGCLIVLPTRGSGSHCPQRDTCWDFPSRNHAPQGDEEFSRQRHDHGRLPLPGGALSPCIIPLGQGALLLEAQEPPRQLRSTFGARWMTRSTSAVAVCCSRASRVSVSSRAFSIAITA